AASVGKVRSIGHASAIAGEANCAIDGADFRSGAAHQNPVITAVDTGNETAAVAGDVDRSSCCMDNGTVSQLHATDSEVGTCGLIKLAIAGDRDRAGLRADVTAVHENAVRQTRAGGVGSAQRNFAAARRGDADARAI